MRIITRSQVPQLCKSIGSLGFENLLVGGCSFTSMDFGKDLFYLETLKNNYNNIKDASWPVINDAQDWDQLPQHIKDECLDNALNWKELTYITWPLYTRDLLDFSNVYDCSCPGAGNKHIHDSIMYALETNTELTSLNTVVVIMWSGYDRDDFIVDPDWVNKSSPNQYSYTNNVKVGITGGLHGRGNLKCSLENIKKIKSSQSRAVENYLLIIGLKHYLENRAFKFVFVEYSSEIKEYQISIPLALDKGLVKLWTDAIGNLEPLGGYAQDTIDGSHPTAKWHQSWAQNILVPKLLKSNWEKTA